MANYLQTQTPTFSTWQPPVDYSLYKGALDEKYDTYQKNASKIQGMLDTVAGLPVGNEADKKYLQGLADNLYSQVNNVASSDFSDQNLSSRLQSIASKIYSDPLVQRSINSAANVQAAITKLNSAQNSGRGYGTENEAFLMDQIQKYKSSTDPGTAFNASYIPYTDVVKKITDTLSAQHAGSKVTYSGTDVNSPVMDKFVVEGIDPNTVRSEIRKMISTDGGIKQQIGINSWYNYKGIEGDYLHQAIDNTYSSIDNSYKKEKEYYDQLEINYANNPAMLAQIKEGVANLNSRYDTYKNQKNILKKLATTDPDQVKSYLYKSDLENMLTDRISYQKMDQIKSENPLYKAALEATTKDLEYKKWTTEQAIKLEKDKASIMNMEADNARADAKLAGTSNSTSTGTTGSNMTGRQYFTGPIDVKNQPPDAFSFLSKKEAELSNQYENDKILTLANTRTMSDMFEVTTQTSDKGEISNVYRPKKGQEAKIQEQYNVFEQKWKNGDALPNDIQRFFDRNKESIYLRNQLRDKLITTKKEVDAELQSELEKDPEYKLYKDYENISLNPVTWKGKNISKEDILLYFNSQQGSYWGEKAYSKLQDSGKYSVVEDYINNTYKNPIGIVSPDGKVSYHGPVKEIQKLVSFSQKRSDGRFSKDLIEGKNLNFHSENIDKKLNEKLRKNMRSDYDMSVVIPSETTKDLANAKGLAKRLLSSIPEDLVSKNFKDGVATAKKIINNDNLSPTFSYHPPTSTSEGYIEIIGKAGEDVGKIPVSQEQAIGSGLFIPNPTAFIDQALAYGTRFSSGNQVVAEANQLPIGKVSTTPKQDGSVSIKYNLSYDIKQINDEYLITINAKDLLDKERTQPYVIQIPQPFKSRKAIVDWANNLQNNPNATAEVIKRDILIKSGKLPEQTTQPTQSSPFDRFLNATR